MAERHCTRSHPIPPSEAVGQVRKLFLYLAHRVRQFLLDEGPGPGVPEVDELVNEAVVALLEALREGRFDPAKGTLTTYAGRIAGDAMRTYARADHFGLSVPEYKRQRDRKVTIRFHIPGEAAWIACRPRRRKSGNPSAGWRSSCRNSRRKTGSRSGSSWKRAAGWTPRRGEYTGTAD